MKCEVCGFVNRSSARFCKGCGKPLASKARRCFSCDAPIRPGAHFCAQCGAPLDAEGDQVASSDTPEPVVQDVFEIGGQISGKVTVNRYNLTFGDVNGGKIDISLGKGSKPRPRPTPVDVRPLSVPGFLDREAAIDRATAALGRPGPVEVTGEPGVGKTSLIGYLAYHPVTAGFPDGVIHLSAYDRPVDDLLRALFDAFYETDLDFHPSESYVRQALRGKRALVLLDDVALSREQIEVVLNAASSCAFVVVSTERILWAGGAEIELPGLPPEDAVALMAQRLGRSLGEGEKDAARQICEALDGHPLRLVQAASLARRDGRSLDDVLGWAATYSPMAPVEALSEAERAVLAMLAALGDWPVPVSHVAGLTGNSNAPEILLALERRGAVETHSPRYSPAGELGAELRRRWELDPWRERALGFYTAWAVREQAQPRRLLEAADVILYLLEWAVGQQRWQAVLRLGRAIEAALALGGRWAAWVRVLRLILQAAQALGHHAAEAWAFHQIGTRALCLEHVEAARKALTQALQLRQSLGDTAAAALTEHNLALLPAPPPPKKPPEEPPGELKGSPIPGEGGMPGLLKALLIFFAGIVFVAAVIGVGVLAIDIIWPQDNRDREVTPYPTERPPVEEPTPTPWEGDVPEILSVEIELEEGCGTVYESGAILNFEIYVSESGLIDAYLLSPEGEWNHLFEQVFQAGETQRREWDAPGEPGEWELVAELNDGQAESRCPFYIEAPPPEIESVDIVPLGQEPVCPDDDVAVRVLISSVASLDRVWFWFRDPPDTGIWFSSEMTALDDTTYEYVIEAREEPGVEFYIYVEDVNGRWVETEPQVYFVDPCLY